MTGITFMMDEIVLLLVLGGLLGLYVLPHLLAASRMWWARLSR